MGGVPLRLPHYKGKAWLKIRMNYGNFSLSSWQSILQIFIKYLHLHFVCIFISFVSVLKMPADGYQLF